MKKRGRPKGSKNKKNFLKPSARTHPANLKLNSVSRGGNASDAGSLNHLDALPSHNENEFPSLSGGDSQNFPHAPTTAMAGNVNTQNAAMDMPHGWTSEECAGLTQLAGLVAASLTSFQGFTYSDDESRMIGEPLSKVLNKYFPDGAGKTDELSLAVVLLATTSPKINAYLQERRKNSEPSENKEG